MLAVPDGWTDQVTGSHVMSAYVQVFADPSLSSLALFAPRILDGSVKIDRTAASRRSVNVTVLDPDGSLTPQAAGDPLSPFGPIMQVFRGVAVPGWTNQTFGTNVFYCSLGLFRLGTCAPQGDGQLQLTGYDLAELIRRTTFEQPYIVPAGTNYVAAILAVGADRLPEGLWRIAEAMTTDQVTPQLVFEADSDPWDHMQQMAAALGAECWFDNTGGFVLRAVPDPGDLVVTGQYVEGGTALMQATGSYDDSEAYNGGVMVAEATTLVSPLQTEVWDDNPASPTYYLGPYGKRPWPRKSTPYAATQAQLDATARRELLTNLSQGEPIAFAALPDSAREEGDLVRVAYPRGGVPDASYVVDQLDMPLVESALMQVNARRWREAS